MWKDISLLTPVYVSLFWSFIFLIQPGKKDKPKILLGVFMMFAFLLYCSHAVFFNNMHYLYSYIEFIYVFCMLSVYPMYFIYLESLISEEIHLSEKLQHFIPAAFFGLLVLITSIILKPDNRIIYVEEILINRNLKKLDVSTFVGTKGLVFLLSRIAFLLQVVHYVFNGIKLANVHNRKIENYYSNIEGKSFNWVKRLSIIIFLVAISSVTFAFIGRSYFSKNEVSLIIPSIIFSTFLFIIGFKGNIQAKIISNFADDIVIPHPSKIKTSQNKKLRAQIIQLFEQDKIHIHPELRITHISESLKTNRTYISKLINEEFQLNFNEFVNKYRINEAKALLESEDEKTCTLELIAEKSGFGSVNSFTRVFKSITGVTPGKYRDLSKIKRVK